MSLQFELSTLDRRFGEFIRRVAGGGSDRLALLASLASSALGEGSVCLDLEALAGRVVTVDGAEHSLPGRDDLVRELRHEAAVGAPGEYRPLILDRGNRLYLHRYWTYEQQLAAVLASGALPVPDLDTALLSDGLSRLFPRRSEGCDWQKIAAAAALRQRFCVISGGPGTGKTSTVVRILALLLEQAGGKPLRIALAAPTGKAAARLGESLRAMKGSLDCGEEITARLPEEVTTLHRLLGIRGDSGAAAYSEGNRLPHDVVIVDEASMVSLPLLARLAASLGESARLILLGDRDQLASVDAGAVLGDICGDGRPFFSQEFCDGIFAAAGEELPADGPKAQLPPMADVLIVLRTNYRFGADSGIGALSAALNAGDGETALRLLDEGEGRGITRRPLPRRDELSGRLKDVVIDRFSACLEAKDPGEALRRFEAFRVLCALRKGAYGVPAVNGEIERILHAAGLIDGGKPFYHGRPVMVTMNSYHLNLFNGDIGIVFDGPEVAGGARVFFPTPDGGVRGIPPLRLPPHETVFAMSIHKSQGSEFDRVLLLLPAADTELLTRELLYTGVTRARTGVEIWGDEELFMRGAARKTARVSGLKATLWNQGGVPSNSLCE